MRRLNRRLQDAPLPVKMLVMAFRAHARSLRAGLNDGGLNDDE